MSTGANSPTDAESAAGPKHLELLQTIIARMAANSFLIKGWAVTLVSALLGFGAKDTNPLFAALAIYPAVAFWGLDAYYLMLERRFRVIWSADAKQLGQGLGLAARVLPNTKYMSALTAPSVWPLYSSILIVSGLTIARLLWCRG